MHVMIVRFYKTFCIIIEKNILAEQLYMYELKLLAAGYMMCEYYNLQRHELVEESPAARAVSPVSERMDDRAAAKHEICRRPTYSGRETRK